MKQLVMIYILGLLGCVCKDVIPGRQTSEVYTGNQLRINGYYVSGPFSDEQNLIGVAILNTNGVAFQFDTSVPDSDTSAYLQEAIADDEVLNDPAKDPPTFKGVFTIDQSAIELNIWNWGDRCIVVYNHTGRIINDTTFEITAIEETNGGSTRDVDLTYRFVPFSPKPDSTSAFID